MTLSKHDRLSIIASAGAAGLIGAVTYVSIGPDGMKLSQGVCSGCLARPGDCRHGDVSHVQAATVADVLVWLGYEP